MSSFNQPYYALDSSALSLRRRNPRFSWEELQILAQETSKNFEVLRQKETDESVKQLKHRIWTVITDKVNAVNRSASRREPLQLKRKWIEARSRVRHKLLASQRRRQELSVGGGAAAAASPATDAKQPVAAAVAAVHGAVSENGASANPVELSYFEKLLTLNMCDEMQEEDMKLRRNMGGASSASFTSTPSARSLSHRKLPVQGLKRCGLDSDEEEEEEEAPSCVTMTPDDLSQEGLGNADVEMWTGSSAGGDEDLEMGIGPPEPGAGKETAASRNGASLENLSRPPQSSHPVHTASSCCLNCGGLGMAQTLERMLSERHALKLNILHNKAHYWYAKCRELAPDAAMAPPSAATTPSRHLLERSGLHSLHSALPVKNEFFDPPMASS